MTGQREQQIAHLETAGVLDGHLGVAETATLVRMHRTSIYRLLRSGEIEGRRHAGKTFVVIASLRRWLGADADKFLRKDHQ